MCSVYNIKTDEYVFSGFYSECKKYIDNQDKDTAYFLDIRCTG